MNLVITGGVFHGQIAGLQIGAVRNDLPSAGHSSVSPWGGAAGRWPRPCLTGSLYPPASWLALALPPRYQVLASHGPACINEGLEVGFSFM